MIILAHVLIALASVAYSTLTFFNPSRAKLRLSYLMIALTVASGTYLAVSAPAHILETCLVGLGYVAGVSLVTVGAHKKLRASERS